MRYVRPFDLADLLMVGSVKTPEAAPGPVTRAKKNRLGIFFRGGFALTDQ